MKRISYRKHLLDYSTLGSPSIFQRSTYFQVGDYLVPRIIFTHGNVLEMKDSIPPWILKTHLRKYIINEKN